MKSLRQFPLVVGLLLVIQAHHTQAAFSSLYAFGDGASTTTNNVNPTPTNYFGQSYCNGRVWVEVLAQWQGLSYDSDKNWSHFNHFSANLTTNVTTFTAPGDVGTALFLVWVNNADFVDALGNPAFGPPYGNPQISPWTNYLNQSLSNHAVAIQTLYNKGVRTLVMPNAADLTESPGYPGLVGANKTFVRQRTLEYNLKFTGVLSNSMATMPGLQIYQPNIFTLLDQLTTNAASFGMTNPAIDAIDDLFDGTGNPTFTGPGANYVFWDYLHPTAKFQMLIAEKAQQLLSPVSINKITSLGATNKLDFLNLPIGRNGFVEVSTNLTSWTNAAAITNVSAAQSVLVPVTSSRGLYRLRLPFVWTWP